MITEMERGQRYEHAEALTFAVAEGDEQFYCLQEQDDEYFFNPSIVPKEKNQNPQQRIDQKNNQQFDHENQKMQLNKLTNINNRPEYQNTAAFGPRESVNESRKFFLYDQTDSSMENYQEEEIEEQKEQLTFQRDSGFRNLPQISKLIASGKPDIPFHSPRYYENTNEFYTKSELVSRKMMITSNLENKEAIGQISQHQELKKDEQSLFQIESISQVDGNIHEAVPSENEYLPPQTMNMTPRKHKYYLYFKSLKNRLAQEKNASPNDISMKSNITRKTKAMNQRGTLISQKEQSSQNYPSLSETKHNRAAFPAGDSSSLVEFDKIGHQISGIQLQPEGYEIISPSIDQISEYSITNQPRVVKYSSHNLQAMKLKFEENADEENIDFDELEQKESNIKRECLNLNIETRYLSNMNSIKSYFQNNQSIPFKLKNIYNTSCDPKKDLDFKMISEHGPESDGGVNQVAHSTLNPSKKASYQDHVKVAFEYKQRDKTAKLAARLRGAMNNNGGSLSTPTKIAKNQSIDYQTQSQNRFILPLSPSPSANSIYLINRQIISLKQLIDESEINMKQQMNGDIKLGGINSNKFKSNPNSYRGSSLFNGFVDSEGILDIGICLLNACALSGISFLVLFQIIDAESESIVRFLMQKHINCSDRVRKGKQGVTEILTDLRLAENGELLHFYSTFFNFSNSSSFCWALRYFVEDLQLENDPEQIDVLLGCFSKRFYAQSQNSPTMKFFASSDAVHMLAFAVCMLDIEIHFHEEHDLPRLILEFHENIRGINDGKDFPLEFVNNIITSVLDKQIAYVASSGIIAKQKQQAFALLHLILLERAHTFVNVNKYSSKKVPMADKNGMELGLFILDNIAIVMNMDYQSHPMEYFRIFSMVSLIISYKNQVLRLKPATIFGKDSIELAKHNPETSNFVIKLKSEVTYWVATPEQGEILDKKLRSNFLSTYNRNSVPQKIQ